MKWKSIIEIIIIALIAVAVFFVVNKYGSKQIVVIPNSQGTDTQNVNPGPNPSQSSITPIDTNVGSVAGIDLSILGAEANESALNSLQDGASDASSLSSGSDFNSTIDSISNPTQ